MTVDDTTQSEAGEHGVPELTDELLRTLPASAAAVVRQLMLSHDQWKRRARSAEMDRDVAQIELAQLRIRLGEDLDKLHLDVRIFNTLRREGIRNVAELSQTSRTLLLTFRGIGERAVEQIARALEAYKGPAAPVYERQDDGHG